MGIERMTYCGPYIECRVSKTITTLCKRTCPNTSCSRHDKPIQSDSEQFCGECGHAIQEVDVEVEVDAVDTLELEEGSQGHLWQPFGDFAETLSGKSIHIWLVNRELEGNSKRAPFIDEDEESVTGLTTADIENEMKLFAREAKKELETLQQHYGVDNTTLRWGILHAVHY